MTWQPIATAPKDGTWVDLWITSPHSPEGWRATNCVWIDVDDPRFEYVGWASSDDHRTPKGFLTNPMVIATHWMPLPEPPDAERLEGRDG